MKGAYEMLPKVGKHRFSQEDGSYRWLHPGDQVTCSPDDLRGVLQKFKVIIAPPPPSTHLVTLELRKRGAGWFDVVNVATGVKLNSSALREEEALGLIADAGPAEEADVDAEDDEGEETFGPDGTAIS